MYDPVLKKLTISEVLNEDPSDYYLPTIQRDYVWDEDDIKEMVQSIVSGYPIGIITVFKTDIDFPSVPLIDTDGQQGLKTKRYILDGQQRLTSLLLIKNSWKMSRDNEKIDRTPIYFRPDDKSFRIKGKRPTGYDFSDLVRMATFAESPKTHLQKTLKSLHKTFLDRPLAFYEVEVKRNGKNEEEIYKDMSEIFTRINRAGIKLGNLEMFLSFFASASVGKQEIIKMHRELNSKYSMDLEPVIRFIFSNLELTQSQITKISSFKSAIKKMKGKYSNVQIHNVIMKCRNCIISTMSLLQHDLGIFTTQVLPAETVLVPIYQYIYSSDISNPDKISKEDRNRIVLWFLLASFNGLYSSQTNTKVEDDLSIVRGADYSKGFPLQKLLDSMEQKIKTTEIKKEQFTNIDFNILRGTAGRKYLFLEYVLLCRNNATDWTGRPLVERQFNDLDRHHIFPRDSLKGIIDEDSTINHIGNLTFIDRIKNEELQTRLPEDYLPSFDEDVLKKHFIPLHKNLWKIDKYEKFIEQRTELLWQGIEDLMENLGLPKTRSIDAFL